MNKFIERIPTPEEFNMLTESVGWGKREDKIVEEALKNTMAMELIVLIINIYMRGALYDTHWIFM